MPHWWQPTSAGYVCMIAVSVPVATHHVAGDTQMMIISLGSSWLWPLWTAIGLPIVAPGAPLTAIGFPIAAPSSAVASFGGHHCPRIFQSREEFLCPVGLDRSGR